MKNIKDFKNKSTENLKEILLSMYKKKFKLLIEMSNNQTFKSYHNLRDTKKNIARLLTLIKEKEKY